MRHQISKEAAELIAIRHRDQREELRRLFVVMRSASKEEVYDERQKQSDEQ